MLKLREFFLIAVVTIAAAAASYAAPVTSPKDVGLVLSGGGARGLAHIGVLKALEEWRIPVRVVAATSMGAMVGGGFALGYDAQQLRDLTQSVDWKKMFYPRPPRSDLSWQGKQDDTRFGMGEVGIGLQGVKISPAVFPVQELDIFLHRATDSATRIQDLSQLSIPFAAMATDLVTGQEVVLQKNIQLSLAMRASMSVPGAFAPVQYEGHLLVDGGLVDNLPVEQARKMGVKRVIAVNVGTPLSGRETLGNVVGVMGQMINLLTEQNVRRSLSQLHSDDVLIVPDLHQYSSADFNKADEIIKAGYEATMRQAKELSAFRVDERTYETWAEQRAQQLRPRNEHQLENIKVRGLRTVNAQRVLSDIDLKSGDRASDEDVANAARHLWGSNDFASVSYHFEPGPEDTEVLVFTPQEKSWGYSTLRLGGNVETNFGDSSHFNVLLAHNLNWANAWGASWRNELQVGQTRRVMTQWKQPLGADSNWYLKPRFLYRVDPFDVYRGSKAIATYRNRTVDAGIDLGYIWERAAEVTLGGGWEYEATDAAVGIYGDGPSHSSSYIRASATWDTLDNVSFPRAGYQAKAWVQKDFSGAQTGAFDNTSYHLQGTVPVALGKSWSALFSGRMAESSQLRNLNLGGVFNLSGSPYGRYTGDKLYFGRLIVTKSLSEQMELIGMPVFAGFSLEAGKVSNRQMMSWQESDPGWKTAIGAFVAVDSWIGPFYLVAGRTFGDGNAVTLYWGKLK